MSTIRPDAGVDVVRVRVSDVDAYTPENTDRITAVAAAITDLGLDVRIVAGSSLTPTGIYLPEYFPDTTATGLVDLGWTVQEWTALGAAVHVETAYVSGSIALLIVALAGAILLATAVQATAVDGRRSEARMLASLGWSRARIIRWFAVEGILGWTIVSVGGVVAVALNGQNAVTVVSTGVAVVGYLILVVVSSAFVSGGHRVRGPQVAGFGPRASGACFEGARPARTPMRIGRISGRSTRRALAMSALAIVIVGLTAGAFLTVLESTVHFAGLSRLADTMAESTLVPHIMLLGTALVAAVSLFITGLRALLRGVDRQARMLGASGWSAAQIAAFFRGLTAPGLVGGVVGGASLAVVGVVANWWTPTASAAGTMAMAMTAGITFWYLGHVARTVGLTIPGRRSRSSSNRQESARG